MNFRLTLLAVFLPISLQSALTESELYYIVNEAYLYLREMRAELTSRVLNEHSTLGELEGFVSDVQHFRGSLKHFQAEDEHVKIFVNPQSLAKLLSTLQITDSLQAKQKLAQARIDQMKLSKRNPGPRPMRDSANFRRRSNTLIDEGLPITSIKILANDLKRKP
jgi:hypothetical protein